jgi:hypothetical protein
VSSPSNKIAFCRENKFSNTSVCLLLGIIPVLITLFERVVCVLVAVTANQLVKVTVNLIVVTLT